MIIKELKQLMITIRKYEKTTIQDALSILEIKAPTLEYLRTEKIEELEDATIYYIAVLEARKEF